MIYDLTGVVHYMMKHPIFTKTNIYEYEIGIKCNTVKVLTYQVLKCSFINLQIF